MIKSKTFKKHLLISFLIPGPFVLIFSLNDYNWLINSSFLLFGLFGIFANEYIILFLLFLFIRISILYIFKIVSEKGKKLSVTMTVLNVVFTILTMFIGLGILGSASIR